MVNRRTVSHGGALAAVALAVVSCAGERSAPTAESPGWVRPADAGAMTAAYLTLPNRTTSAQVFVGARADGAVSSTLHETRETDGTSSMHPLDSIVVTPGDSLVLQPRGRHVMVHGLSHALAVGDTVALHLALRGGDTVRLRLPVLDK